MEASVLRSYLNFLDLGNHSEQGVKKGVAYNLIKRDIELIYKLYSYKLNLGDIDFFWDSADEMTGFESSISILFEKNYSTIEFKIKNKFEVLYDSILFQQIISRKDINKERINSISKKFVTFLSTCILEYQKNEKQDFAKVFFKFFIVYYPDLEIGYFQKNYKKHLKTNTYYS